MSQPVRGHWGAGGCCLTSESGRPEGAPRPALTGTQCIQRTISKKQDTAIFSSKSKYSHCSTQKTTQNCNSQSQKNKNKNKKTVARKTLEQVMLRLTQCQPHHTQKYNADQPAASEPDSLIWKPDLTSSQLLTFSRLPNLSKLSLPQQSNGEKITSFSIAMNFNRKRCV